MLNSLRAALIAAVFAAPVVALAQEAPLRSISVTGEGEINLAPDMATILVGVKFDESTPQAAMDGASAGTRLVLDTLASFAVPPEDIQTAGVRLSPRYIMSDSGMYDQSKIVGYIAENTVTVTVRDLDSLGDILGSVVGAGANDLGGVSFGLQDASGALDLARQNAVADAIRRAELYAQAAGVGLGALLSLSEGGNSGVPMFRAEAMMMDGGGMPASVPVSAGLITISAFVNASFLITD